MARRNGTIKCITPTKGVDDARCKCSWIMIDRGGKPKILEQQFPCIFLADFGKSVLGFLIFKKLLFADILIIYISYYSIE